LLQGIWTFQPFRIFRPEPNTCKCKSQDGMEQQHNHEVENCEKEHQQKGREEERRIT
jgi:hypothetical protein